MWNPVEMLHVKHFKEAIVRLECIQILLDKCKVTGLQKIGLFPKIGKGCCPLLEAGQQLQCLSRTNEATKTDDKMEQEK